MSDLRSALAAVRSGPRGPEIGAFFDFDGTLIDGFSAAAYFADRLARRAMDVPEMIDTARLALRSQPTDDELEQILRDGVAAWAGRTEEETAALWERLFRERLAARLYPEAWELVRAHRRAGHTVVIASSATQFQVAPVAAELSIDHVVCTRARVRSGRLTGGLDAPPVWGPRKAAGVERFAAGHGIDLVKSHAYGNGTEDVAFLGSVGNPTAVNPSRELARVARERDWPVLRFAPRGVSLEHRARSVAAYAAMAGTLVGGLAYAALSGKRQHAIDLIGSIGAEIGLALGGIELGVLCGEEHLWAHRPCVFILNHQSQLDYFVMLKLTRERFTGVAKKEAADVPGFGPFMRMTGMAFIDRANTAAAIEGLKPAVEKLREGVSIGMSPEGTRSYSPKLGRFKKGAFHIARQAGVPIVPVVLRNAGELMTRDSLMMRPGRVEVVVLPPVYPADWKAEELDRRIAEVRDRFVATLESWPGDAAAVEPAGTPASESAATRTAR